jgi:AraC family transcriptional regulator
MKPVRFASGRPMLLGGLRRYHTYTGSEESIPLQWQQFRATGSVAGAVGSVCYGVMCGHDAGGFEYMCALEVDSFDSLSAALGRMRILEQEYAVFEHSGHISTIRSAWQHILHEWLPKSGYRSAHKPDFERYDDQFDSSAGFGRVEIWIAIIRPTLREEREGDF